MKNIIDFKKIDYSKLGFFRFKKLNKNYLLTGEAGDYVYLTPQEFNNYLQGKLEKKSTVYKELSRKNFINGEINLNDYIKNCKEKNQYLLQPGPSLHIIVATLRCNHRCLYCQTSSAGAEAHHLDMKEETARKIVDFIFQSPNPFLAIEFQGGEPLFNWPVIKDIVELSQKKSQEDKRNLELRLVSNFTLMDEEKMNYLFEKGLPSAPLLTDRKNYTIKTGSGSKATATKRWLNG